MRARRGRAAVAVVAAVAVLASCGGGATGAGVSDLPDVIATSNETPRVVTETSGSVTLRVRIEDDYRYEAETSVAGRRVVSETVYDDRRFLRFDDAAFLAGLAQTSPLLASLPVGQWVEDRRGAQPEFGRTDVTPSAFPASTVLDRVRFLETLPDDLAEGSLRAWNPDAAAYLESEDRFPPHEDDGTRFDVLPRPFDRDGFFRDGLPVDLREALEPHFQYVSVWVEAGRVRRVELLFDPPDLRHAIERALRLQAERSATRFDPGLVPQTPPRLERSIVVEYPADRPVVRPPDGAVAVDLPAHASVPAPSGAGGATGG